MSALPPILPALPAFTLQSPTAGQFPLPPPLASLPAGTLLNALVTASNADGRITVTTPQGNLSMQTAEPLPQGTPVTIQLVQNDQQALSARIVSVGNPAAPTTAPAAPADTIRTSTLSQAAQPAAPSAVTTPPPMFQARLMSSLQLPPALLASLPPEMAKALRTLGPGGRLNVTIENIQMPESGNTPSMPEADAPSLPAAPSFARTAAPPTSGGVPAEAENVPVAFGSLAAAIGASLPANLSAIEDGPLPPETALHQTSPPAIQGQSASPAAATVPADGLLSGLLLMTTKQPATNEQGEPAPKAGAEEIQSFNSPEAAPPSPNLAARTSTPLPGAPLPGSPPPDLLSGSSLSALPPAPSAASLSATAMTAAPPPSLSLPEPTQSAMPPIPSAPILAQSVIVNPSLPADAAALNPVAEDSVVPSLPPSSATDTSFTPAAPPLIDEGDITARVIGSSGSDETVLQTPLGTLKLFDTPSLPIGTAISWRIQSVPPPEAPVDDAFAPAPPFDPATAQAVTALSAAANASPALAALLPQPGKELLSDVLSLISALKGGDVKKLLNAAHESGKDDSIALGQFSKGIDGLKAQSHFDAAPQQWNQMLIPLLLPSYVDPIQLFWKDQPGESKEGGGDDSQHFLLDMKLSQWGQVQFDGLVKKTTPLGFDLIIRSQGAIPPEDRQAIAGLYHSAGEAAGFRGSLQFRQGLNACVPLPNQPAETRDRHSVVV